jgi:hypothetical protein
MTSADQTIHELTEHSGKTFKLADKFFEEGMFSNLSSSLVGLRRGILDFDYPENTTPRMPRLAST